MARAIIASVAGWVLFVVLMFLGARLAPKPPGRPK